MSGSSSKMTKPPLTPIASASPIQEAYISFLRKKLKYLGSSAQIVTQRKVGYRLEAPAGE